jgi:predicted Na+-dependent transporter
MGAAVDRPDQQVQGLPVWYLVLAGALVASYDISHEFPSGSPARALVPLGILLLHVALWVSVLRRRMRYTRAVLRSPRARVLAVGLAVLRSLLGMGIGHLYTGPHPHLVIGLIMFAVVPGGIWCDQWLILRVLRKESERAAAKADNAVAPADNAAGRAAV